MAQAADYNSTWAGAVRAAANRGQLSHAVILTGEGDKLSPARYIAAAHLCRSEGQRPCLQCNACRKVMEGIHPDVTEVRDDDRKELAVDTIRALWQDVYIRPNEGERKVYLFTDCAQLNERDQNVLLKIVEEGPAYAAFVFCADTLHALLPTIRSRCVELRLEGQDAALEENEAAAELCRVLARRDPLALAAHLTGLENHRVKRADNLAQHPDYRSRQQEIDRGEAIMEELLEKDACFSLKQLAVNGQDMMALGLQGPAIGKMLQALLDAVIDGAVENDRDALLSLAQTPKN